MASLQPVERHGEATRFLTPCPFGIDGPESASGLPDDLVWAGQWDGELPVRRGSSRE